MASTWRERITATLQTRPEGMYMSDIADMLAADRGQLVKNLQTFRLRGVIRSVAEGDQVASRRHRYYLPEHEAAAMSRHEELRGITWGTGRKDRGQWKQADKQQEKPQGAVPARVRPSPMPAPIAVARHGAKVVVCPAGKDYRFSVAPGEQEHVFGAMLPGQYLEHESAIARAYR